MEEDEDKASWDPYQASKLQGSASDASRLSLARPRPHDVIQLPSSGSLDLLSSLPSVPGLIVFSGITVGLRTLRRKFKSASTRLLPVRGRVRQHYSQDPSTGPHKRCAHLAFLNTVFRQRLRGFSSCPSLYCEHLDEPSERVA